jgi:hypothetical protein
MFLRSVRSIRMFLNFSVAVWTSVPQAYRLIFPSDPGGNDYTLPPDQTRAG